MMGKESGALMLEKVHEGKIRNHKLSNASQEHFGEHESREAFLFADFLKNRNFYVLMKTDGDQIHA